MKVATFIKYVLGIPLALLGVVFLFNLTVSPEAVINSAVISQPANVEMAVTGVQTRVPPFERTVFSAGSTTTVGASMNIVDYQTLAFTLAAQNVSSTVQFQCSMADLPPDFSATSSPSNRWDYVSVKDYQSGSSIAGTTGLALANSSTVRQFVLLNSNFRWCTVKQSNWTTGTTTVMLLPATNQ